MPDEADPIIQHIARAYGKVCLLNVEVAEIERKIYTGSGRAVPYYWIRVKDGFTSADLEGLARLYPCTGASARVSERVFNKANPKVGSRISFRGDLDQDSCNGVHLKNVLKIETTPVDIHAGYIASADHVQDVLSGKITLLKHQGGYQNYAYYHEIDDDVDADAAAYGRSYHRPYYLRSNAYHVTDNISTREKSIFDLVDKKGDGGKTFRKIQRALTMLAGQRNLLMIKIEKDKIVSVVKSQTTDGIEYATCISETGDYFCCPQDLEFCLGMKGYLCKHIILSLAAACKTDDKLKDALKKWVQNAQGKHPIIKEDIATSLFVESKLPKDARIGWREIEILPEDMMAF
ncbi:MAG: hypothetical protein Q6370_003640 [Candidatus Sigynarchaeota archaeon]